METKYCHKVLIVDDDEAVGKIIGKILTRHNIDYEYITSGEQALDLIKKAENPFSLIISDHNMPGMDGTQFLAQAKKITPETVRFLITGYSEMPIMINALNKGSINRFISKSENYKDIIEVVKYGLEQFELIHENKKLVFLEAEQNKKLYKLNSNLMKTTKHHGELVKKMNERILSLKKQILAETQNKSIGVTVKQIEYLLRSRDLLESDKFNRFSADFIREIYKQFCIVAKQNGFDMPLTKKAKSN